MKSFIEACVEDENHKQILNHIFYDFNLSIVEILKGGQDKVDPIEAEEIARFYFPILFAETVATLLAKIYVLTPENMKEDIDEFIKLNVIKRSELFAKDIKTTEQSLSLFRSYCCNKTGI